MTKTDVGSMMEDWAEDRSGPPTEGASIQRVVELAERQVDQQELVNELAAQLKLETEALRKLQTEELPTLMDEIGLKDFSLRDGARVRVMDEVACGITKRTQNAAHNWLAQNGFGGLIKTQVLLEFGRGEHEAAEQVAERLTAEATNYDVDVKEAVHHSTLKAFVKEQLERGVAVPADLFNLHPYRKAVITRG